MDFGKLPCVGSAMGDGHKAWQPKQPVPNVHRNPS
jgi:hypothetical protein